MSLDKMLSRKKKSVSPDETASGTGSASPNEEARPKSVQGELMGAPAVIPEDRTQALREVVNAFKSDQPGSKTFSMNELLKMDDSQKGLAEILGVVLGAQENDMYRMLERCRLTKHEKQVYVMAIHFAEHGLGYNWGNINLDFPIPFYGDLIVKHLRGSVSVDGESLATFERTTSTWVARLYATQQAQQQQGQRGIIQ
jgi:hypothetical protein